MHRLLEGVCMVPSRGRVDLQASHAEPGRCGGQKVSEDHCIAFLYCNFSLRNINELTKESVLKWHTAYQVNRLHALQVNDGLRYFWGFSFSALVIFASAELWAEIQLRHWSPLTIFQWKVGVFNTDTLCSDHDQTICMLLSIRLFLGHKL